MKKIRCIFLDIDGPMIPLRAYSLVNQTKGIVSTFDPCAVGMLNKLITDNHTSIVISSTWASKGFTKCFELLQKNGVVGNLHPDWRTPRKMTSSRTSEIAMWLDNHPEITHYCALDDEMLDATILPSFVQCDPYEGFSYRNFLEAKQYLDIITDQEKETLHYLRRREIWRTQRNGDPLEYYTWEVADKMFPVEPNLQPHWYRGLN